MTGNRHKYNVKNMKNMKLFVVILSLCLLCGCHTVVGNWLESGANNHLIYGERNAHQRRFRVDGCYVCGSVEDFDSIMYGYVFYSDGICSDFYFSKNEKNNGVIDFGKSLQKEKLYPKQWQSFMGVYEIRNDTVYCDMYRWMDLLHIGTQLWRYEFAIVDSCTLKNNRFCNMNNDYNFHFVPCTNIVYPRAKFVKDRKWMWKTKEDWQKYKESKKKKK